MSYVKQRKAHAPRCFVAVVAVLVCGDCLAETRDDALAAAKKAVAFYTQKVATEGGYLWRYSADLKLREGEGKSATSTIWVQPPGTPAMGAAFVKLYDATSEAVFLDAARGVAEALRRGQLRSGGWQDHIDFDPADRARVPYRTDSPGMKTKQVFSSLDDDKTQSSLRFLVELDRALEFKAEPVHEMTAFALDGLLRAQYPNGAFPQVWGETRAETPQRRAARYPTSWPRAYPGHGSYWFRLTLNDNLMPDVMHALWLAAEVYDDDRCRAAARNAADFLLLAQLPEPQPAWAQQYDFEMHPAWARKFEPPAVTGGESQGVLRILLEACRRTGEQKYLRPIPRALAYLKKSLLADGRLARFYELKTNQPLYFTRDYTLTYDDTDLPTHYGFKVPSQLDAIEKEYDKLLSLPAGAAPRKPARASRGMEERVRQVVADLDERGAWVTDDKLRYQRYAGPIIDMAVAVKNLTTLAEYLKAR